MNKASVRMSVTYCLRRPIDFGFLGHNLNVFPTLTFLKFEDLSSTGAQADWLVSTHCFIR